MPSTAVTGPQFRKNVPTLPFQISPEQQKSWYHGSIKGLFIKSSLMFKKRWLKGLFYEACKILEFIFTQYLDIIIHFQFHFLKSSSSYFNVIKGSSRHFWLMSVPLQFPIWNGINESLSYSENIRSNLMAYFRNSITKILCVRHIE